MFDLLFNQQNLIEFVMVDSSNVEVPGLGAGFTLEISKNGGAFVASAGAKSEKGSGWYEYLTTAAESDTIGPIAIRVTGAGAMQQNLAYRVKAELLDEADGVEAGLTLRQAMRLLVAAMAGKLSGAATVTVTIRNAVADNKNRIIATVDADGNRQSIIYDLTD